MSEVTFVKNLLIPMRDGTKLAADLHRPAGDGPFPVILEYLPYRKDDVTAADDALRHPYVAGHGYACARVDMRGSGASDGVLVDEYSRQEHDDALEVIAWLAEMGHELIVQATTPGELPFSRVSAVAVDDGNLTAGAGPSWSTAVGAL